MTNDNLRDCCQTPEYAIHDQRCPIIVGPHARSHIAHTGDGNRNITSTVYCMCGSGFTADDERDARAAHTRHAVERTADQPEYCADPAHTTTTVTEGDYDRCGDCGSRIGPDDRRSALLEAIGPAASPPADIYDATSPPGVTQLPAVTTSMTPAQFKEWLASDGTLFMVILPANRTFVIKVPTAHHEFFVAMMQQVRFALGPEVQAVRMNMVTGPGADVDAATGKADEAPEWAQPDIDEDNLDDNGGAYKMPDGIPDNDRINPPTEHLVTSPNECPICDAQPGQHCTDPDGEPLRRYPAGVSTTHNSRNMAARPAADENDPPTHCPHGLNGNVYCARCDRCLCEACRAVT